MFTLSQHSQIDFECEADPEKARVDGIEIDSHVSANWRLPFQ
jgi:hypothetical protein